jgi:hypothetical protein
MNEGPGARDQGFGEVYLHLAAAARATHYPLTTHYQLFPSLFTSPSNQNR